jgi:hypothetical protein
VEHFPPHLTDFAPGEWVDEYHWHLARWQYGVDHPGLHELVDPIGLLRECRAARLAS